MKRKIIMAFLAFFPLPAIVLVSGTTIAHEGEPPDWVLNLWGFTILVVVAGLVTFLRDAVMHERVPKEKLSTWVPALLIVPQFALPAYFIKVVWRPRLEGANQKPH